MKLNSKFLFFIFVFALSADLFGQTVPVQTTGKAPVIVIPGITGSSLIETVTNEEVWFKFRRPKSEDIRLPISPNLAENRDKLEARDIMRGIKIANFLPEIEIYERLNYALEKRGGYREAKWNEPGENAHQDTFYVFPYDWRLDNVENARLLIKWIEALKVKLKKPTLKFHVVAHSMGGLIARYAAMYGDADIPAGSPTPTWAGSKHLDKIFLLGTPNEGSILTLRSALIGYSVTGYSLPFLNSFDRFDVFTMQSIPQLLPSNESLTVYDENFKKLTVDIYDLQTWDNYDWSIWDDKNFRKKFNDLEERNARPFFAAVLNRAKRFHEALRASGVGTVPVQFYLIGGDCKDTPVAALVVFNAKKKRWETIIHPKAFVRSDGTKVTEAEVKEKLTGRGDGSVPLQSLLNDSVTEAERSKYMPVTGGMFQCAEHTQLVTSADVQDKLLALLKQK